MKFPDHIGEYKAVFESIPKQSKKGSNRHLLKLFDKRKEVASLRWNFDEDYVWVIEVLVNEDYRRKKIATMIYDNLQILVNKPIKWTPNAWASNEMREFVKSYIQECHILIASKIEY